MDALEKIIEDAKCESRAEALVAVVHVATLHNGYSLVNDEPNSDGKTLHSGWNSNKSIVSLTYHRASTEAPLRLTCIPSGDEVRIDSKDSNDSTIASHALKLNDYVNDVTTFDDANKLYKLAIMGLPGVLEKSIFAYTQGQKQETENTQQEQAERAFQQQQQQEHPHEQTREEDETSVGATRFDPKSSRSDASANTPEFGRIGADDLGPPGLHSNHPHRGMLFDPRQPGGGIPQPGSDFPGPRPPPGAIVPGARYDPIGPLGGMHGGFGGPGQIGGPGQGFRDVYGPDFDELPPPGMPRGSGGFGGPGMGGLGGPGMGGLGGPGMGGLGGPGMGGLGGPGMGGLGGPRMGGGFGGPGGFGGGFI